MENKITISAIEGNRQRLDGGAMFGNAPRKVWETWTPPDAEGRILLSCRALLIQWNNLNILCETGIGCFFEPKMSARFGVESPDHHMLLENLTAFGLKEEDIDYVVLSHLHFDHAGGLLPSYAEISKGNDQLLFPRATYIVGEEAMKRAKNPHMRDRASFIPGLTEKLEQSKRLHLVNKKTLDNAPFSKDLEFITTNGHTPGQMHVLFSGKNSKVFFCGDLIPGSWWIHTPITMGYDRYPELLIDEKNSLYERALKENWLLFFTHDPINKAALCEKNAKGAMVAKNAFIDLTNFIL